MPSPTFGAAYHWAQLVSHPQCAHSLLILRACSPPCAGVVNGIDYQEWSPVVDPHLQSGAAAQHADEGCGLAVEPRCAKARTSLQAAG